MTYPTYLVVCREDRSDDGEPGAYTLATRRSFDDLGDAQAYSTSIAPSREPMIIGCGRPVRLEPLGAITTEQDHKDRHQYMALVLDELLADIKLTTGMLPMKMTVEELRTWALAQAIKPQLPPGTEYLA